MNENSDKLDAILGEQLSSVEFVQDYVQLHFDGPYLIAFTWPIVETKDRVVRFGEPGYRDSLCDRIGRKVQTASSRESQAIIIGFDDGATIRISLSPGDRTGPEAALYRAGGKTSDPILEF